MSCCVSSAICCLILVACTSGVALGYNYSLAEYIDLKETNVSVFIKRGVFDDEIAEEDGDMRRVGGGPAAGIGADVNLRRDSGNTNVPVQSGRRLDDTIIESDSQNKFESSLMKLTAKPPHVPPTTTTAYRDAAKMEELISNFPPGSLDQMKAMQAVVNARKAGMLPDVRRNQGVDQGINPATLQGPYTTDHFDEKIKFMNDLLSGRKFHINQNDIVMPSNALRDAVPRMDLAGWPKDAVPRYTQNMNFVGANDLDYSFGHPPSFPRRPPVPSPSRIRPPTSPATQAPKRTEERIGPASRTAATRETPKAIKAFKEDLDKYKQRLLINQYDEPNFRAEDFPRRKPDEDDYEEEFKGAPVRRKRDTNDDDIERLFDYTIPETSSDQNSIELLLETESVQSTETAQTTIKLHATESLRTAKLLNVDNPLNKSNNVSKLVLASNYTENHVDEENEELPVKSNRDVKIESLMKNDLNDHQNKKLLRYKNHKTMLKVVKESNVAKKWTRRKIRFKKQNLIFHKQQLKSKLS